MVFNNCISPIAFGGERYSMENNIKMYYKKIINIYVEKFIAYPLPSIFKTFPKIRT